MSSAIAQLRVEIQARKFRRMEISGEIDRKVREIRSLLAGFPLAKIKDMQLALVADIAAQVACLQERYLTLQDEIEAAEKELDG